MDTVWALLDEHRRKNSRILFEGAQGIMLDVDHGTYPYVTSSNTVAAQAATGSGLGPRAIKTVLTAGIDGIAFTKLDVLDGLDPIRICTGYRLDGREIGHLPASQAAQARLQPVYEDIEGWKTSTQGARTWAELPAAAVKYVRRVEKLINCPVALLSTSPERDDTILVQNPFQS